MMRKTTFIALALAATLSTGAAEAAKVVGNTVAVNPDAKGTPPGAQPRTLVLGTGLVFNERIDTSGEGLVQVLLLDGTSMIVGPNSSIAINKFVYDPEKRDGSLAVTLSQGTMRFIGGALSKKKGAQITTPVGTLAIRGAIADLTDRRFSLVFGKEIIFTGKDGKTVTIPQGVTYDSGTGEKSKITQEQAKQMMDTLRSKSNGGADDVTPSDVNQGSNEFTEATDQETTGGQTDGGADFGQTETGKDIADGVIDTATTDQTREKVADITCPPSCMSLSFRILTAPFPSFNVGFGPVVFDPGSQGFVGGTDDPDADTVAQAVQIDANTIRVTRGTQTIDVPFSTAEGTHVVPPFLDFDGNTQQGNLFVGADAQFFFYALFEDGDIDAPTYAFGGTETPPAALTNMGSRLLSYDVFADPRQGILIPLTLANLVQDPEILNTGAVSPFYVMTPEAARIGLNEPGDTPGAVLFGSLLISGQRQNQVSVATMLVGTFFDDNGVPDYGSGSRGSMRPSADLGALVNGGGISLIKGQPDRNVFFGPDANNAVLSTQMSQNEALGYSHYRDGWDFESELLFSTMHVLDLTANEAEPVLRGTKTYEGYAAGMLESGRLYDNGNGITSVAYRSTSSSLELNLDAERDTMGASFTISDIQNADPDLASLHLSFGFDPVTLGLGRGTYVDDDRFGASASNNPDGNVVVTDLDDEITITNDIPSDNFAYFFNNELAVQTGFFPEDHPPCVCAFLEWGYWGGRRDWFDTGANEMRHEFVHLGTWVAGDISNEADLPTSGEASYAGHVVGNVTRNIDGTDYQYIAGGGFNMDWSFQTRTGTASISDFDGINASTPAGGLTDTSVSNALNSFTGTLSGTDTFPVTPTPVSGGIDGSFVSGPGGSAAGVIGSFDLVGASVSATGIVAGEQVPQPGPPPGPP
jgi:hypothetical protein